MEGGGGGGGFLVLLLRGRKKNVCQNLVQFQQHKNGVSVERHPLAPASRKRTLHVIPLGDTQQIAVCLHLTAVVGLVFGSGDGAKQPLSTEICSSKK